MAAAKKGGLGKGLGALIAEAAPVEITRSEKPIEKNEPDSPDAVKYIKTFDIIWVMTKGGPMNTSATPALLLYTEGFQNKLMGRSSAIGMILLIMGLVISVVLNNTIFKQDDTF